MINQHQFQQAARLFRSGKISLSDFQKRVFEGKSTHPHEIASRKKMAQQAQRLPDITRVQRCGWPETVSAKGKSLEVLVDAVKTLDTAQQPILIHDLLIDQGQSLAGQFPDGRFDPAAKIFTWRSCETVPQSTPPVIILVETELAQRAAAQIQQVSTTVQWMGGETKTFELADQELSFAKNHPVVLVTALGQDRTREVAQRVGGPIFAVPLLNGKLTGKGPTVEDNAALLELIQSSPANVAVVSIGNGFKAGYLAMIAACNGNGSN